jgi:hypothetical protein
MMFDFMCFYDFGLSSPSVLYMDRVRYISVTVSAKLTQNSLCIADLSIQETAAAIKVQSVFRRNKAMAALESEGVSTSAMRNRKRRRRAKSRNVATTEDTPGVFSCCGVGLLFGDASEDDAANRAYAKAQYEERRAAREEDEARKRQYKSRVKDDRLLCEAVEAVY